MSLLSKLLGVLRSPPPQKHESEFRKKMRLRVEQFEAEQPDDYNTRFEELKAKYERSHGPVIPSGGKPPKGVTKFCREDKFLEWFYSTLDYQLSKEDRLISDAQDLKKSRPTQYLDMQHKFGTDLEIGLELKRRRQEREERAEREADTEKKAAAHESKQQLAEAEQPTQSPAASVTTPTDPSDAEKAAAKRSERYNEGEREVFSKAGVALTWNLYREDDKDTIRIWRDGDSEPFKTFRNLPSAQEFFLTLPGVVEKKQERKPQPQIASVPASVPAGPQLTTFRVLASPDDAVDLDTTRQLLTAIARSKPPELTFTLTADGNGPEVFITLTCNSAYIPTLEPLVRNFFRRVELVPEEPMTAQAGAHAAEAYRLNYPHAPVRRFSDFNPDPLAMFCTLAEGLQPAERVWLTLMFAPATPQLLYAGDCEWLEEACSRKTLPAWSVELSIEALAAQQVRADALLTSAEHYLQQFSNDDLTVFQDTCRTWKERQEKQLADHYGPEISACQGTGIGMRDWYRAEWNFDLTCLHNYTDFVVESFKRKPHIEFVRWTDEQKRDFLLTLWSKNLAVVRKDGYSTEEKSKWKPVARPSTEILVKAISVHLPEPLWSRSYFGTDELAGLVHLPHKSVTSPLLQRANMQSQKAPDELTQPTGLLLGTNEWRRQTKEVRLPHDFRSQHMYLLGASGSGKSTLLLNLIKQDIETGRGLAVIDPHGDLVNDTLQLIPKHRIADTVYIDMADVDYPVSLNPFSVQPKERAQAADEFVLVFERMFLQDAQRAKHILYFTIASLLEAGNTTPLDIETFLTSRRFRNQILERLQTPRFIRFVDEDFAQYEKAVDPIVNKLARFSVKPEVSALLGQAKSHLNFYDIMQQKKILLLKLMPERQEDSQLIGGFLVSQLQLAAMRRNQLPIEQRVPFSLYIDEFQNFMSGSAEAFSKILSEARKYNLCLVLAHQYMGQLDDSVRQAIFANARSHIFFRTSPQDGQAIRLQLGSFTPEQVSAQARGQAIAAVTGTGQPFHMQTFPPPQRPATDFTAAIIEHTHGRYAVRPNDDQQAAAATTPDNSPPSPPAPQQPPASDAQPNILDDLFGKK